MNIKYNKEKHELREDPIINGLLKAKEFAKKQTNTIIGAAIVVLFVVGVWAAVSYMQKSSSAKAQEAFGRAMIAYDAQNIDKALVEFKTVTDNHRRSPQGVMSAYMLGSIYLGQAKYNEAITWFEIAIAKKDMAFVYGQALEGLATSYERKGDVANAIKYFEMALKDDQNAHRHPALKWKLALLYQNKDAGKAKSMCTEIISDTTAVEFKQQAENLLAVLNVKKSS